MPAPGLPWCEPGGEVAEGSLVASSPLDREGGYGSGVQRWARRETAMASMKRLVEGRTVLHSPRKIPSWAAVRACTTSARESNGGAHGFDASAYAGLWKICAHGHGSTSPDKPIWRYVHQSDDQWSHRNAALGTIAPPTRDGELRACGHMNGAVTRRRRMWRCQASAPAPF